MASLYLEAATDKIRELRPNFGGVNLGETK